MSLRPTHLSSAATRRQKTAPPKKRRFCPVLADPETKKMLTRPHPAETAAQRSMKRPWPTDRKGVVSVPPCASSHVELRVERPVLGQAPRRVSRKKRDYGRQCTSSWPCRSKYTQSYPGGKNVKSVVMRNRPIDSACTESRSVGRHWARTLSRRDESHAPHSATAKRTVAAATPAHFTLRWFPRMFLRQTLRGMDVGGCAAGGAGLCPSAAQVEQKTIELREQSPAPETPAPSRRLQGGAHGGTRGSPVKASEAQRAKRVRVLLRARLPPGGLARATS